MKKPRIDPEFKALIPPLTPEEVAGLESDILLHGALRDNLVVWATGTVLLDGHHRLEICERHGIGYATHELDLPDRDAAKDWIEANQLSRRNLTADQRTLLMGRRYNRAKKQHGGEREASGQNVHLKTGESIAKDSGVDERTVRRAAKSAAFVDTLPPTEQADIMAGKKRIKDAKRERKEATREERREENRVKVEAAPALAAQAKFATIVCDPPWDWGDEGDCDQLGRAKPTYATMSIEQLAAMPVPSDSDCHLYLWITNRSLPKGFALMTKWGFRYVTCLTWPKPSFGMGNYFRGQTEHVLFGIKGSQPLKRKDAATLLPTWKRGPNGHSSKPTEFYEFVESCSPGPYLEMFAREKRDGWASHGAEAQ